MKGTYIPVFTFYAKREEVYLKLHLLHVEYNVPQWNTPRPLADAKMAFRWSIYFWGAQFMQILGLNPIQNMVDPRDSKLGPNFWQTYLEDLLS